MPLPPPPANELVLYARTLAGVMRRGMSGASFAWILRMRLGMDYVRQGAFLTADQVLEQFRAVPEAWEAVRPLEDRFAKFWDDTLVKFREMIEAEDRKL